jgi:hypothetical protein
LIPEKRPERRPLLLRKAAGAQITQSQFGEVVTRNTSIGLNEDNDWNENNVNTLTTNNWRASLVPAAAVIPAPRVYIKVVAVKKLVVGLRNLNLILAERS